jgi:hypothetical protein
MKIDGTPAVFENMGATLPPPRSGIANVALELLSFHRVIAVPDVMFEGVIVDKSAASNHSTHESMSTGWNIRIIGGMEVYG